MLIADRYELGDVLGEGGMGSVMSATDRATGRVVAVKLMRRHLMSDAAAVRRFEREMHTMMRLEHPNTVRLYDFGRTQDDELFLVMERVRGRGLDEEIREHGALAIPRVVRICKHIARGLAAVHAEGIVHRDLKPQNIMLRDLHGEPDWALVLDFGIAALENAARVTDTGLVAGSPAYCSPEQAKGLLPGPRGDLYMLGVVLYEMLTGRLPFEANSHLGFLFAHVHTAPRPVEAHRPDVPRWLSKLVLELLDKDPARRPKDASTLLERLERGARAGGDSGERRASAGEADTGVVRSDSALTGRSRARTGVVWTLSGLGVGCAALVVFMTSGGGRGTVVDVPPPMLDVPRGGMDEVDTGAGASLTGERGDESGEVSGDGDADPRGDVASVPNGDPSPAVTVETPPPVAGKHVVHITSNPSGSYALVTRKDQDGKPEVLAKRMTPFEISCEPGAQLQVRVTRRHHLPAARAFTCSEDIGRVELILRPP